MSEYDGGYMEMNTGAESIRANSLFTRRNLMYGATDDVKEALDESRMFRRFVKRSFWHFDHGYWGELAPMANESNNAADECLEVLMNNVQWRDIVLSWWKATHPKELEEFRRDYARKEESLPSDQIMRLRIPLPAVYAIYHKIIPPDDRLEGDALLDDFHIVVTRGIYDSRGSQGVLVLFPDEVPWLQDDGTFDGEGWSYLTYNERGK